ncbi:hypothetical protein HPA02_16650 [Bisbaumannia pacifica]|uniref:Uncharacterized protein n=1 Tax=Bisbaumannia pacifica TaxID=77098 RepID=A0A510X7G6_9GAMM|nr:hypothetical protein [Halomonas pacifica]GEK47382.1 hypothetical protein HPA02_16650 [Halomonas pacifica]
MSKRVNKHRVQAGKTYKVTFGVNQTQKINKAANAVDETPQKFLKTATADKAKAITGE